MTKTFGRSKPQAAFDLRAGPQPFLSQLTEGLRGTFRTNHIRWHGITPHGRYVHGKLLRPFRKKPSSFKGKNGSPERIHVDRNYRCPGPAGDQFETFPHFIHKARPRDLALRENADQVALFYGLGHRHDGIFGALFRNRNHAKQMHEPGQQGVVEESIIYREDDFAVAGRGQDQRIDITHVIRNQESPAGLWKPPRMQTAGAVDHPDQTQHGEAQKVLRDDLQNIDGSRETKHPQQCKLPYYRHSHFHPTPLQGDSDHHPQGVQQPCRR